MWIVLPIKDLADAKQRLAPVLSPAERRDLFHAMLEDVASAIHGVREIIGLLVVSKDPAGIEFAERHNARVLREADNQGQTTAVTRACRLLASTGVDTMMQIPGDVPMITADEIRAVIAAHKPAPSVTIAPARDERGSNCVVCSPPDVLPLQFGHDSFHPHLAAARDLAIEPTIVKLSGFGLDIDTPEDLKELLRRSGSTGTHTYLQTSGIADRLVDA